MSKENAVTSGRFFWFWFKTGEDREITGRKQKYGACTRVTPAPTQALRNREGANI
jgi:hypothetical protein